MRWLVAVGTCLLLAGMHTAVPAKEPNSRRVEDVRDALFGLCTGLGYADPVRTDEQMQALSAECASKARDAAPSLVAAIAQGDQDATFDLFAKICADAPAVVKFPTPGTSSNKRTGACLVYSEKLRKSDLDVIEAARRVPQARTPALEDLRVALGRRLEGQPRLEVWKRLQDADFVCGGNVGSGCWQSIGVIEWQGFAGIVWASENCRIRIHVSTESNLVKAEDISTEYQCE